MTDKALLLGINKYKKVSSLRGCVNDVDNMRRLLTETFRFKPSNIKVLLNDKVVKKEVKAQMAWLLKDAKPDDRLVFHYSGHGSQIVDLDGDEDDGADELLCLYDMDFNDPDSYLLDDELLAWTKKLPAKVDLTIVLDSCHSGTGTRMLMAPMAGRTDKKVAMMVDPGTTVARALGGQTQARGLGAAEAALMATDPEHDDVVRVRYVEPPPAIREAIEARGKKKDTRGLVVAKMNHVLLAGCRDNQTSADATIENTPNGAFTFHLCRTIRTGGANLERRELINRVERALRDSHFTQVPQLEGPTDKGPLFRRSGRIRDDVDDDESPESPVVEPGPAVSGGVDELKSFIPTIASLAPEAQVEALRQFASLLSLQPAPGVPGRAIGERCLVYVHGICKHDPGYSNGWWSALRPFTNAFGVGALGSSRREVLWSDLVNERALEVQANREIDSQAARQADEQQ